MNSRTGALIGTDSIFSGVSGGSVISTPLSKLNSGKYIIILNMKDASGKVLDSYKEMIEIINK
jgi:hypothetical protein